MAINPTFHTALMGFQKAEVLDCLNRMASEIDTYASRQEAADKTIASMKAEIQNLTQRMENLTEENYNLESANAQLRKESFDFDAAKVARDVHEKVLAENQALKEKLEAREDADAQAQTLAQENAQLKEQLAAIRKQYEDTASLRQECDRLRGEIATAEEQRRAVQDALISAQRMGQIVLKEAKDEANRVTTQARQEAEQTRDEAQKRVDALQASYDRMLMDTGKMKSELIELYRRHLALLAEIPGQGEVPVLEDAGLVTVEE